jgi:hypothetical protein
MTVYWYQMKCRTYEDVKLLHVFSSGQKSYWGIMGFLETRTPSGYNSGNMQDVGFLRP